MLAVVLGLAATAGAFAQALNPTPTRASKLIASFEDDKLDGWVSDPNNTGANVLASFNTDPKYVSDGKGSMKVDMTDEGANDIGGWKEPILAVDLAEPLDLTDWGAISMDVYVPAESLYPDTPGGWFQFLPRLVTANGTVSYGNRDCHAGWNHLVWNLASNSKEGITRIYFATNTDGARPWTGPIYIDNVRAWKSLVGLQPDETLIFGFDKSSDVDLFTSVNGHPPVFNSDKQYISQGDGSFSTDLTDISGWKDQWLDVKTLQPMDLSKATAIHLDVFVPNGVQPTDWWQLGFHLFDTNGAWLANTETMGLNVGEWDTIELAVTPDMAANLKAVTGFGMATNCGQPWTGAIYVDNLRAVIPAPTPTVVKGDLSGDGKLAINDVTLALQIAVGLRTATADQLKAGDLDGNGKIDIAEVTRILKAAVGLGTL